MTENRTGQQDAEKRDRRNKTSGGFRLKYIGERLMELDAERDRLVGERKTIRALRKSKNEKPEETED